MNVALCLPGHMRNYVSTYPFLKANILDVVHPDIFIHTWDNIGLQEQQYGTLLSAPYPNENSPSTNAASIQQLLDPRVMCIENNQQLIAQLQLRCEMYLLAGQAREVHIMSQLYSVYRSCQLKTAYEQQRRKKYDIVIKMRPDYQVESPIAIGELQQCISDGVIIVPDYPQANHGHPVCDACKNGPHKGPHAREICDVFAFSTSAAMDHYCGLFQVAERVFMRACLQVGNARRKEMCMREGDYYVVPHECHLERFATFNPERLLMHHLEGYRVIGSSLCGRITREERCMGRENRIRASLRRPT